MSVCICMEFQYVDRQMSIHCYKVEYTYLHMPPPQAIRIKQVFHHFRQGGVKRPPPPPNTQTETYIANKRKDESHNDH